MRAAASLLAALALVACQQEPSFDERYDAAHEQIEGMAQEIDGELETAMPRQDTEEHAGEAEAANLADEDTPA